MMKLKIHPLVIVGLLFIIALLAFIPLVNAQDETAQIQPHELPIDFRLTAVYPNCNTEDDPNSFWAIRLAVGWEQASYYVLPDGKFVLTGSAVELPGATLVFVSNGENNHGSAAWINMSGAGG